MSEAPLGFAVAAPILRLAEGERTITLLAHLVAAVGAAGGFHRPSGMRST